MREVFYDHFKKDLIKYRKREITLLRKTLKVLKTYPNDVLDRKIAEKLRDELEDNVLVELATIFRYSYCIDFTLRDLNLQRKLGIENKFDDGKINIIISKYDEKNDDDNRYYVNKTIKEIKKLIKDKQEEIKQLSESRQFVNGEETLFAKKLIKRYNREAEVIDLLYRKTTFIN